MGVDFLDCRTAEYELTKDQYFQSAQKMRSQPILFAEGPLRASMKFGNEVLRAKSGDQNGVFVFTGSLHIVSAVLGSLQK